MMGKTVKIVAIALCGALAGCLSEDKSLADGSSVAESVELIATEEMPEEDGEASSRKTYEELARENRALKAENRKLRRELVRQCGGEPTIDLSRVRERQGVAGEEANGKATDDGGHWLATEKMRRHNSKCKYYKLGRGRPCEKGEGTPCRRCGG